MKKIILSLLTISTLVFVGCKKESTPTPEPIINLLIDEEPQSLVDTMDTLIFNQPMITEVSDVSDATILDYPLFLDQDPFETILVRRSDSLCIKGIEVTSSEKEKLQKAWITKIDCQKTNKSLIARINREIESWAKTQKENLYKSWYMPEKASLDAQLKNNLITEAQYLEKIKQLNLTWKSKMEYLNKQVKEKIKNSIDRATAVGKIKDCEKVWLNSVLEILGKNRYKKWIECYKKNYRTK